MVLVLVLVLVVVVVVVVVVFVVVVVVVVVLMDDASRIYLRDRDRIFISFEWFILVLLV